MQSSSCGAQGRGTYHDFLTTGLWFVMLSLIPLQRCPSHAILASLPAPLQVSVMVLL